MLHALEVALAHELQPALQALHLALYELLIALHYHVHDLTVRAIGLQLNC